MRLCQRPRDPGASPSCGCSHRPFSGPCGEFAPSPSSGGDSWRGLRPFWQPLTTYTGPKLTLRSPFGRCAAICPLPAIATGTSSPGAVTLGGLLYLRKCWEGDQLRNVVTSFVSTFRRTATPRTAVLSALGLGKGIRSMTSTTLPRCTGPQPRPKRQRKKNMPARPQAGPRTMPFI